MIIAVYNVEEYLSRCLQSVCGQTWSNLDIILVDDGSTDGSGAICDAFAAGDRRIRVIHKENGGLSSARNAGLQVAAGSYLYFLDSDDYIEPTLVERAMEAMEASGSDWCGFGAVRENARGQEQYRILFREGRYEIQTEERRWQFLLGPFLNYLTGWEVCFHVYRREIVEKYRLRFTDERLVYAEDLLFSFSYLLYANRAIILPDALYHYTEREQSLMSRNSRKNVLSQVHRLAAAMYQAVQRADRESIRARFSLLYLSLMEWHSRDYIEKDGVGGVKQYLEKIPWQSYLSPQYFAAAYQEDAKKYGRLCGMISVVVTLEEGKTEEARRRIGRLLQQSIQRLDILVLSTRQGQEPGGEPGSRLGNDCRVRWVCLDRWSPAEVVRQGFARAYGEYLYFAREACDLEVHVLRDVSDAIKYNRCTAGVLCGGLDATQIKEGSSPDERRQAQRLLEKIKQEKKEIVFQRTLWDRCRWDGAEGTKDWEERLLLSGKTIFLKKDKKGKP